MHNTGLEQWTGVRVYLRKTMYCISKVYPKYMVVGLLANLDESTEAHLDIFYQMKAFAGVKVSSQPYNRAHITS
jgi:hypothetical protein